MYNNYILNEDNSNDIINNSLYVKNASAKCIRTFKVLTYELEKVVDVEIRLIEMKNPKSKDLNILKRFKDDLEELKKYSMEELNIDEFQINIKDTYKRIGDTLKEFSKVVIYTAERNDVQDQLGRVMSRIPKLSIEMFSAVDEYSKVNKEDFNNIKQKINTYRNNPNKKNNKVMQESMSNLSFILNEDILQEESKFGTNVMTGITKPFSHMFNIFDKGWDGFDSAFRSFSGLLTNLINSWSADKDGGNWSACKNFLTSDAFVKTTAACVAVAGAYVVLRKVYGVVKRWFNKLFRGNEY